MDNRWMGEPTMWGTVKECLGIVAVVLLGASAVIVTVIYYIAVVFLFTPIGWILLIWWLWYA